MSVIQPGVWVVLEGPDGAGKTTAAMELVSILTERGPTVSQHLTSTSAFDEYYAPAVRWQMSGLNVVQDRCVLSDLVYAPVLRGVASKFGEAEVRRQLEKLARHAVVLHFTAVEEELAARLEERGDDLISPGQLHYILKGYHREVGAWVEAGAHVAEFDTTGGVFPGRLELELAVSLMDAEL